MMWEFENENHISNSFQNYCMYQIFDLSAVDIRVFRNKLEIDSHGKYVFVCLAFKLKMNRVYGMQIQIRICPHVNHESLPMQSPES